MTVRILKMAAFAVLLLTSNVLAQTTAFNFQGRLNDGASPANGRYDLQFRLFDSITGGTLIGQTDRPNTLLVNGVFSTTLDFGPLAFATGANRFLEIGVRPSGSPNAYVVLGARQQLLSVPYSVHAATSANADNASNATTAQTSLSLNGVAAANFARLNFSNQGDIVSATNLAAGGGISVAGNATQPIGSHGFIKAMMEVNDDLVSGNVSFVRCYNGVTGASTGNCGFTITATGTGIYRINFGFAVNGRFVSAIARYNSGATNVGNNIGANYQFPSTDTSVIEIFTFESGNADDTTRADFTLIVY